VIADRLPALDGVRAIAALTIVAYHVAFVVNGLGGPAAGWLAHLNIGVTIFFVLSGLLLSGPLLRPDRPRLDRYAARRALRIVPAYWVALPIVALWLGGTDVFTADRGPQYLLFAQQYSADTFTGGIGQAWTLNVEVVFYALLPLWALALRRAGSLAARLGLLAGCFAASLVYKALVAPHSIVALTWFPGFVDHFCLGIALALLAAAGVRLPARAAAGLWAAALAGYLALGWAGGVVGTTDVERALVGHTAKGLIAVALVAPAVLAASAPARLLGTPALRWVGLVSYGVYLWHLVWIEQLHRWGVHDAAGLPAFTVAAVAGALLLGWASWELVERPAMAVGRRLERRPGRRPADVLVQEHSAP
jgi:peptidoglycan/LPS O-acetylase OafA/YrhL